MDGLRGRRKMSPLKLIIMSATLRIEDFTENRRLFDPPPPLIKIAARQHPVTVHFNKVTPMKEEEYEEAVFAKVCKIHVLLPKGHVLVFLTGRRQIEYLCHRLNERFKKATAKELPVYPDREDTDGTGEGDKDKENGKDEKGKKEEDEVKCAEDLIMRDDTDGDADGGRNGKNPLLSLLADWKEAKYAPVNVLPLYSLLDPAKQAQVFERQVCPRLLWWP